MSTGPALSSSLLTSPFRRKSHSRGFAQADAANLAICSLSSTRSSGRPRGTLGPSSPAASGAGPTLTKYWNSLLVYSAIHLAVCTHCANSGAESMDVNDYSPIDLQRRSHTNRLL